MKIALIGCGAIGWVIAKGIARGDVKGELEWIMDLEEEPIKKTLNLFSKQIPEVAGGLSDILESDVDIVVEAASVEAARSFLPKILEAGKDTLLMSTGALAEPGFLESMIKLADFRGARIYLPSGAIGGLDALKSASVAKIEKVEVTTIKNPKNLEDSPLFREKGIKTEDIKKKTIVFDGMAKEAIQKLPANVNISVAVSLKSNGEEHTRVKVIADPEAKANRHEIKVKGDFGKYKFKVENISSPDNPKTSYLAALSAIATLKKISEPLQVGT